MAFLTRHFSLGMFLNFFLEYFIKPFHFQGLGPHRLLFSSTVSVSNAGMIEDRNDAWPRSTGLERLKSMQLLAYTCVAVPACIWKHLINIF